MAAHINKCQSFFFQVSSVPHLTPKSFPPAKVTEYDLKIIAITSVWCERDSRPITS